jgi:hypothetical protein
MNKHRPGHPVPIPLAIHATPKPPPREPAPREPAPREPAPLWTSGLTSKPVWSGRESDLLRARDNRASPLFPTINLLLGTWNPARNPIIQIRQEEPLRRETAAPPPIRDERHCKTRPSHPTPQPAETSAPNKPNHDGEKTPHHDSQWENPQRCETTPGPTPGPLRNGNPRGNPNLSPRCGAKTRFGCPCRGPAMKNGRCRMHGGASTGPKTAEGRARIAAARTTHGAYGAAMRTIQTAVSAIAARGRVLQAAVKSGFPMAALAPLLRTVTGQKPGNTLYAVSPLSLLAFPLTPAQARRMVTMIRAQAAASTKANAIATAAPLAP